jgi:hypothetical protein
VPLMNKRDIINDPRDHAADEVDVIAFGAL